MFSIEGINTTQIRFTVTGILLEPSTKQCEGNSVIV